MTTKDLKDPKDVPNAPHDHRPAKAVPLPVTPPPGLPLYLAEKVWEWDQKIPVMETKATKDAPKPVPPPPPVEVYLAEHVNAQARTPDRWKATVISALVTAGIYLPVHDDDPRRALNDLLVNNALPLPHEIPVPVEPEPEGRRR